MLLDQVRYPRSGLSTRHGGILQSAADAPRLMLFGDCHLGCFGNPWVLICACQVSSSITFVGSDAPCKLCISPGSGLESPDLPAQSCRSGGSEGSMCPLLPERVFRLPACEIFYAPLECIIIGELDDMCPEACQISRRWNSRRVMTHVIR